MMSNLPMNEKNDLINEWDEDELVEQIWQDSGGRYSQQQIRSAVQEISSRFREARVKQFVPIFIRRETMNLLDALLPQSTKVNGVDSKKMVTQATN